MGCVRFGAEDNRQNDKDIIELLLFETTDMVLAYGPVNSYYTHLAKEYFL